MKSFAVPAALAASLAFSTAEEKAPPPSAGHDLVWHDELQLVLLVNAGPPVRNLGGVAYDSDRKKLVLHGGGYDLDHSYSDTWEWDAKGADGKRSGKGTWKKFEGKGPGVRDHSRLVYDPVRKLTVLFGGQIDLQHFPRDAWLLDAKGWHAQPALKEPRTHARMEFDPGVGLVMVGGMVPGASGAPVVTLGKSGWTPLEAPQELARRYLCALAFDADREVLVLFGGGDPAGSDLFADTWESDGKAWRKFDAKH